MAKIYPRTDLQKVFEYFMQYGIKIIPIDINEENPSPYDFYPLIPPNQATSNYLEFTKFSKPQCYFAVILGLENEDLIVLRINAKDENELSEKYENIFSAKPKSPIIRHSEGYDLFFTADHDWLESMIYAVPEEFIQFSGFEPGTRKQEGYLMMLEKHPYKLGHCIQSIDLDQGVKLILCGMVPVPPTSGYSRLSNISMRNIPYFDSALISKI